MSGAWSKLQERWEGRIARAEELAERSAWTREVLNFYARVLKFQSAAGDSFLAGEPDRRDPREIRSGLSLEIAVKTLPQLASIVREHGPAKLAEEAAQWLQLSGSEIHARLDRWLDTNNDPECGIAFFPRALLQPQAEHIADRLNVARPSGAGNQCPVCHRSPQLAVIRPEGDGGKRTLLCSFCQTEWDFRRVLCPSCGEENHEKLPRFTAEGVKAVRVEACETCSSYLKSVDLTVDGLAVPLVDEVASAPLDLWAAERGYRKIMPNLVGF